MWQFILILMAAALLFTAFKLLLFLLVIAGLIFRTRETIGLLAFGLILNGFAWHPFIGIGLTVLLCSVGYYFKCKEDREKAAEALTLLPPADD